MSGRQLLLAMGAVWCGIPVADASALLLQKIAPTLWLFAGGFLLAYVFDPLLDRLERRHWSRARAVFAVMCGFILCLALLAVWPIPSLIGQTEGLIKRWPEYSAQIQSTCEAFELQARAYLNERFPDRDFAAFADQKVDELRVWGEAELLGLLGLVSATLLRSVSLLALAAIVIFIALNFMMIADPFRRAIREALPGRAGEEVASISHEVNAMLGQYVRGQAMMCLIMAVLATTALISLQAVFGTQYALVIGAMAGLLYLVPWIGPFLTNVAAVIFGYVTAGHDPLLSAACALAAMTTINLLCDNVITPRVIGRKVGLHPLIIVFSLLAGYQVLGIIGMIVATPIAASVKIILARWLPVKKDETKPGTAAPLTFDIHGAIKLAMGAAQRAGRRMESAIGMPGSETKAHPNVPPLDQTQVEQAGDARPSPEDTNAYEGPGTA